jgi:hypothetical protein
VELKEIKHIFNIPFTESMILGARDKANALGSIHNSILSGGGNTAGYLGEEALAAYIGADIISCDEGTDKYNHDLYLDGQKIEIKTKRRTVKPLPHYEVSVAQTSKHQRPDLYIFLSLEFDRVEGRGRSKVYYGLENIWVCGQMEADRYFDMATLWEAGRVDTSNNFKTHVNMYNLSINFLDLLKFSPLFGR